jgi:hypothetical protein
MRTYRITLDVNNSFGHYPPRRVVIGRPAGPGETYRDVLARLKAVQIDGEWWDEWRYVRHSVHRTA